MITSPTLDPTLLDPTLMTRLCFGYPPHTLLGKNGVIVCYRRAIFKTDIKIAGRGCGSRAFRSSLASSMVNDGIPNEAVRKTLGYVDPNAISHYAKLDLEQLRLYALEVPIASGKFADFLTGKSRLRPGKRVAE